MPIDWNIVDDDGDPGAIDAAAEDRLNVLRVRAVMLDRRAVHRRRMWALGRFVTMIYAAWAIAAQAHLWWAVNRRLAAVACCVTALLVAAALRVAIRLRRDCASSVRGFDVIPRPVSAPAEHSR